MPAPITTKGMIKQLLVIFGLISLALASQESQEQAKHHGCGCRHSSSSSSSSSSSCSSSSSSCSLKDAHKKVLHLQRQWNALISACDYDAARVLASPQASTSIIENGCLTGTCCVSVQNLAGFLNRYSCGDELFNFALSEDSVKMFPNGTIVVSQQQVNVPIADRTVMTSTRYNYHWTPIHGCYFKLTYITGNSANCGTYIDNVIPCAPCQ